jgi:hypothetical protein
MDWSQLGASSGSEGEEVPPPQAAPGVDWDCLAASSDEDAEPTVGGAPIVAAPVLVAGGVAPPVCVGPFASGSAVAPGSVHGFSDSEVEDAEPVRPQIAGAPRRGRPPAYLAVFARMRAERAVVGALGASGSRSSRDGADAHADGVPAGHGVALATIAAPVLAAPMVPVPVIDYTLRCVSGYLVQPELSRICAQRIDALAVVPDVVDSERVEDCLAWARETRAVTLHRGAVERGSHHQAFKTAVQRYVVLWYMWACAKRERFEEGLASDQRLREILVFFEQMRYDETPSNFVRRSSLPRCWPAHQ